MRTATSTVVTEIPKKDEEKKHGHGGMEGMGDMGY